ncbi:hypothetical protein BLOT_011560 [Blomia tropicalis]|nr:hypothetical protein BLOT_011560 [Blomia tropicalis]
MIVISQQFNNQSYIDEAYFSNILNARIKFYNIELEQHRLIFITILTGNISINQNNSWTDAFPLKSRQSLPDRLMCGQFKFLLPILIKFNLSLMFYYGILKLDLLDANLERYSEIQFQSCLSLHHPNNCCDQFPCPSFNFSNHTYFYLVNQFHTRLLITSHCIQGIFRQFEMAITPGYCDV